MKIFIGILLVALCLPSFITADSAAGAAAAAASSGDDSSSAAVAASAASGGGSSSAAAAAAASSTNHHTIDCNCPRKYKPVCGSDGRTYSNECILNCVSDYYAKCDYARIYVKKHGHCPHPPCKCKKIWKPVCASNNQTFANDCHHKCENQRRKDLDISLLFVKHHGICTAPWCICSNKVIPVCGTDNKTYRNICILQCSSHINQGPGKKRVRLQYHGACLKEACKCGTTKKEVCASDKKTYLNKCILGCQNRRRENLGQHKLKIERKGKCPCICPAVFDPVCGSNHKTYENSCVLNCENNFHDYNRDKVYILHKGACVHCSCTKIYDPVCASDGNIYSNPCTLNCENKKRRKAGKSKLTVAEHKFCCKCKKPYKPLCNSHYRTNDNQCSLDCENWSRHCKGLAPLTKLYNGKCVCTNCRKCSSDYQPVCGSDRNTYWNICWLNCNITCRPYLWLLYYGRCYRH